MLSIWPTISCRPPISYLTKHSGAVPTCLPVHAGHAHAIVARRSHSASGVHAVALRVCHQAYNVRDYLLATGPSPSSAALQEVACLRAEGTCLACQRMHSVHQYHCLTLMSLKLLYSSEPGSGCQGEAVSSP